MEERGLAEGNTDRPTRPGRSAGPGVPSGLDRVREVARKDKDARFTALLHHVTIDRLRQAYWAIRPQAAAGVDGVTWGAYGVGLEERLQELHGRVQRGSYRAKPSWRAYIPKADRRLRPLGIASLEDKIVQRAVVEVLNAIYEEDFLGFSYGFRAWAQPARCAGRFGGRYLAPEGELDTRRGHPRFLLQARSGMAEEVSRASHCGQEGPAADRQVAGRRGDRGRELVGDTGGNAARGSASPLLANVYLHYVLDRWAQQWRRRHARGDMIITRFADDFIAGFEHRGDARQFLHDLRERFANFGLELHPDKTRLIEFGRFAAQHRSERGIGKPETFDFLGFTHICGTTLDGRFWLRRITIAKRMRAKLKQVKDELRRRWHQPVPEQGKWLASVVRGHLAYYAVPGNIKAVTAFRNQVKRHWHRALKRRSQRSRVNWARIDRLAARWLPPARIVHSHPALRFDVRTQGRSPVR